MHKTDMQSDSKIAHGILATLSGVTPAKGNIVDLKDAGAATFDYITGTIADAGAAAGFSVEIQESDSTADADFTAVADADLVGLESDLDVTADDSDNVAIGSIGYVGAKRYVRAVVTGTTGTDGTVAGIWRLERLSYAPPASHAAANIAAT
jgi:hypothetical protein